MKSKLSYLAVAGIAAASIVACKKSETTPVIPPSEGQTSFTFNGGAGGPNAANSAYVDMSSDKNDSVKRASWDLGFFCGADFKVALNNTTSAGAKVITTATDLATVTAADTIGLTLATSQTNPQPSDLAFFDAIDGTLSTTVIPAVSATATDNKVVVINRGTGGGIAARPWIKAKFTRNATGGYTVQYGNITQTSGFTTVSVDKDAEYNFKFLSFDGGTIVKAEPKKLEWDFTWGYSVYQTNFGSGLVPYNFSDLIAINVLGGVKAYEEVYASSPVRDAAFTAYNTDSVNATSNASLLAANRWAIGSAWRSTQPATGVKTDRFYVLKDAAGNYYKIKFISMGVNDGGERGKPVFEYKLIK